METGTLKDLQVQPGDVVRVQHGYGGGENYAIKHAGRDFIVNRSGGADTADGQFNFLSCCEHIFRIVSRAKPAGPVRTVTRKEIVPGTYGKVKVDLYDDGSPLLRLDFPKSIAEIRAAIATLTEIADALEGGL